MSSPRVCGSVPLPVIAFDPDTWVTTVTESMTFASIDLARVDCVFHYAQPHNWAAASAALARKGEAPFFKETTPGRWKDGAFENTPLSANECPWVPGKTKTPAKHLLEIAEWDWSPQAMGGSEVILTINNFRMVKGRELSFEYALHHCKSYKAGIDYPGILDVDGGSYLAKVTTDDAAFRIFRWWQASRSISIRRRTSLTRPSCSICWPRLRPASSCGRSATKPHRRFCLVRRPVHRKRHHPNR